MQRPPASLWREKTVQVQFWCCFMFVPSAHRRSLARRRNQQGIMLPGARINALYDSFVDLLPSCGDVESNPGLTEKMFPKILDEIRQLEESSGAATQRLSETFDKQPLTES
ncbi:hypothetical protein HPB48_024938 [Haemaphysalis longicornis]|uniref:Uncharacterized protein n=1 Tax=Haemaphysalis longicornis TaxID=44386 RepID=A0A9J6GYE4_HAELO|nr:hypothetical protein HPB48_024938 [Haemaphysalis longicornis]